MENDKFWQDHADILKMWRKQHPAYAPQIYKIQKSFEDMRMQYQSNMQKYHQHKSISCLNRAEKIKQEAEQIYKKLSKLEFLATLTKKSA